MLFRSISHGLKQNRLDGIKFNLGILQTSHVII